MKTQSRDYRMTSIRRSLSRVKKVIVTCSGKGGVGKTVTSALLAVRLKQIGFRTGILDLDFASPAIQYVLGIHEVQIREGATGILAPEINGIRLMSSSFFVGDAFLSLRGNSKANALREILSITDWDILDYLIIDMPPGSSDEILELSRVLQADRRALVIATPCLLSRTATVRLLRLLPTISIAPIGLILNMISDDFIEFMAYLEHMQLDLPLLAAIPYDLLVPKSVGNVGQLLDTAIGKKSSDIAHAIVSLWS